MKKIAVLRANVLGDYIFILPALQALREAFPDAEIVLLAKSWHKEFLAGRPGPVDRVEVVPPCPGVGEKESFIPDAKITTAFFQRMRKEEFDVAIQMHGGGYYSNPFLKELGAKLTIGLKTSNAAPLDINISYVNAYSEMLRFLEVVAHLGAVPKELEARISVTEKDLNEARSVLRYPEEKHIAVIHPGASDRRRCWPAEYLASVADLLIEQGYQVYITGINSELPIVEKVLKNTSHPSVVHNLCGKLSLCGMTGLLSLADVMVSNDTGPLHLARALQTPTIGICWTINAITGMWLNTNIHRSLISWDPHCPICGVDCMKPNHYTGSCKHETSFTANISVEEVKEALEELLLFTSMKAPV